MSPFDLHQAEALDVLRGLDDNSVDAVITDPPYCSGGAQAAQRSRSVKTKYAAHGADFATFAGDHRDQWSWTLWSALWAGECFRVVKPGGYFLSFIDWRQYGAASAAMQVAGFTWRGTVTWDKTEGARPASSAHFRHQAEFIQWGSKGDLPKVGLGPWAGVFRCSIKHSDKHHITGKPTALLLELCKVCPEGGVILDPFMGSGTTGVAALRLGRKFIGIEQDPGIYQVAEARIQAEVNNPQGVLNYA